MKNKIVLLVLVVLVVFGAWYVYNNTSSISTTTNPATLIEKIPATKQETPTQIVQTVESQKILYKNTKYGFEFSFDPGYKDLWSVGEEANTEGSAYANTLLFTLKNAPNPDIFSIHIYTKNWWTENAEMENNKSSWKKGEERSLGSALGMYLGENTSFVFTLWPNDQTCPDLGSTGGGPLCQLTQGKTEMVMNSFAIVNQ